MNNRALLLSAAAAALLTAPALAQDEIKTVVSHAVKTSTAGASGGPDDILIDAGGGISFKSATVPALTIDSSNNVNDGGSINDSSQDAATAVQIDANGLKGSFLSNGSIDLTGSGGTKKAIYLSGTGAFTGNITLDSGSVVSIVGDNSVGLSSDPTATLNGDWILDGTFSMRPSTAGSTTASGIIIGNFNGITNGNITVTSGATYAAVGQGAQGIVLSGPINACSPAATAGCTEIGTFTNSGTISVAGVGNRSLKNGNPESGTALSIENSIAGGILNDGPATSSDTTTTPGVIVGNGFISQSVSTPVIVITPSLSTAGGQMTIGADIADPTNGGFSFINRGSITATPEDQNVSAETIEMSGTQAIPIVFKGNGLLTSGSISANAVSINPGSAVSATAMEIGSYVTLPEIYVSAQTSPDGSTGGSILATVSGPQGGIATAITIDGTPVGGAAVTSVPEIVVEKGGQISASASASVPQGSTIGTLTAIAIHDDSNSLVTINNMGSIRAVATLTSATTGATLTDLASGLPPVAVAVDTQPNSVGLKFTNNGLVQGDVLLGSGSDTYIVQGTGTDAIAVQTGAVNFGFSNTGVSTNTGSGAGDFLHVGQFANVGGAITAQGTLDVTVDATGTLSVDNIGPNSISTTLAARDLTIAGGSDTSTTAGAIQNTGTLNLTVSQGVTTTPVITVSDKATLAPGADLHVLYGSIVTSPTPLAFVLIQAPTGGLSVSPTDVARYNAQVGGSPNSPLPFLFANASITTHNDGQGHDDLLLTVTAKSLDQLGLTGFARQIQPFANAAITRDTALGAAMIAGINSAAQAQKAYDAFAPDVSGGARAIAISLTDQATGPVAARLRDLRLFSKEPGDLTLWGTQFGEYMSTHGQNVAAVAGVNAPSTCTTSCASVPLNGFKDHGFGFSLGLDEGSPEGGWYGGAFTFYTGDVAELGDRQSTTQTLWYMLTAYSTWRGRGLFVDFQANVGYGDFRGKRILSLVIPASTTNAVDSTFTREADSKRAGLVASLGGTIGAMLKYGFVTAIPQLSIDGMSLREEGYSESNGGAGIDLKVSPSYSNSLRAFLGSEFRTSIDAGDFFLQPSVRAGYRFDFLDDPVKLHAQFADDPSTLAKDPGAMFTIQGPDPARGNVVLGAALNATTEDWTVGLNYDFVRGSNNATEQVGTISLLGRI